jgi:arylsulfatase A-like enzyme
VRAQPSARCWTNWCRWLDRNTIIVFVSDNGGARNNASNNGPLRDGQHSVYEGGIRVPFLMRWPARLKPNIFLHETAIFAGVMPATILAGRWKLVNNCDKMELFDVEQDESEKNDVDAQKPEDEGGASGNRKQKAM